MRPCGFLPNEPIFGSCPSCASRCSPRDCETRPMSFFGQPGRPSIFAKRTHSWEAAPVGIASTFEACDKITKRTQRFSDHGFQDHGFQSSGHGGHCPPPQRNEANPNPNSEPHSRITKRTHSLGAPVQSSGLPSLPLFASVQPENYQTNPSLGRIGSFSFRLFAPLRLCMSFIIGFCQTNPFPKAGPEEWPSWTGCRMAHLPNEKLRNEPNDENETTIDVPTHAFRFS
jgi:hypothetical protein